MSLEPVSKLLHLPFRALLVLEILMYICIRSGFCAPAGCELTALAEF